MSAQPAARSAVADNAAATAGQVFFRYVGPTAITVIGPVTGRRYSLFGPGATASVDPRDAPSVAAVPHLLRVMHR